jgi:hypothetical protein
VGAVYEVTVQRRDDPLKWVPEAASPQGYEAALRLGRALARQRQGVRVRDGFMTLAEWGSDGQAAPVRAEEAGCDGGCGCADCVNRAAHLSGEHEGSVCAHKWCRACWPCDRCDRAGGPAR